LEAGGGRGGGRQQSKKGEGGGGELAASMFMYEFCHPHGIEATMVRVLSDCHGAVREKRQKGF